MKKHYLLLILLVLSSFFATVQAQTIHYVKVDGTGNGSSWATASGDIQLMINNAAANDAVWVAKGIYKPNRPANDLTTIDANNRYNAFVLKEGLQLYGGFAGTETLLTERDLSLSANKTTLSGDFNGDDVITGAGSTLSITNNTENALHVVISAGNVGTARLDGFTITGGRAREIVGSNTQIQLENLETVRVDEGGGILIKNSSPTVINCIFIGNDAFSDAGMHMSNITTKITVTNNTFSQNSSQVGSVGSESSSDVVLKNLIINDNYASFRGGAIVSASTNLTIINSTIIDNVANSGGNGIYSHSNSEIKLFNSLLFGDIFSIGTNVPILKNSIVDGTLYNNNGVVTTTTTTVATLFEDSANGDYSLKTGSIAVNAGSNTLYTDAGGNVTTDKDLAGNSRVFQSTIDLGAYESQTPILTPDANNILYVNKSASGEGTGDSWANATTELAYALVWAQNNKADFTTTPLQIWVVGGTYKPMYSPEDGANFGTNQNRRNTFLMVNNVQLYGGFAGTETLLIDRDLSVTANKTTLSGDLGTEDVVTGSGESLSIRENETNAVHVVLSAGDVGTALLDGFTITRGNANLSGGAITVNGISTLLDVGGGMYNNSSSPKITNTNFIANSGDSGGGGMVNLSSSPNISNSTFSRNYGSGMLNQESSPIITSTSFIDNNGSDGGGIANFDSSSPTIKNSIFSKNAAGRGGAIFNYTNSSPIIINSTFSENSTIGYSGDAMQNYGASKPKIYNSIVWGDILNSGSTTPEIKNSIVKGNSDTTNGNIDATNLTVKKIFNNPTNGDYSLNGFGPAINAGDNTLYTGTIATDKDLADNARLFAGIPDPDVIDMGAYEYQAEPLKITATNNVLYINKTATGNKTGDSWANAIPELADALVWANKNKADFTTTPLQIWVAGGTYKPLYSPEDGKGFTSDGRNNTFLLVNNVEIYGGFTGTEAIVTERDFATNKTILSGDLGTVDDTADNAYHVVISAGDVGSARLDGFTITAGYSDSTDNFKVNTKDVYNCSGSGIYNSESTPFYKNLIIEENNCTESGGGMFSYKSTPSLHNIIIQKNEAKDGGGMANQYQTTATLLNVSILNNSASVNGSGLYNVDASNATLTNVTLAGNRATVNSQFVGVGCEGNSTVTFKNSIIWDEISGDFTGEYSLIKDETNTDDGNIDATSLTETAIFKDPENGDYSLNSSILNPAINTGDNALYTTAGGILATDKDVAGNPRLFDGVATTDVIDLGAYEYQVEPTPLAPTVALSLQIYAGAKTVSDLAITGTAIKWYDAQTAGNFLESTTALADDTTYYASQTVNGVESTSRVQVTAKKISEDTQTFLSSANPTVANLVSTPSSNATVKWFTTATSSTVLENTDVLTTGIYFVEQTTPLLTIETLGSDFSQPFGVALQSDGKILVADTNNNVIKRMDADGTNIQILGSGFNKPRGVAVQSDGKILIADAGNNAIKRMDADGSNIVTLNSTFNQPHGVALQSDGKILVADSYNSAIKRMDADGSNIVTLGTGFSYPYGITVQSDGKILVADAENSAVKRMDADGSNIQILGTGYSAPSGVALQSDGKILVVGSGSNPVIRMNADGTNTENLGTGFSISRGIAVQSDGKILVADTFNNAIKRITEVATSNRIAVAVVIIPPVPTTSYTTQVFAGDSKTLADLQITGTAIKWYDAPTEGNFLANTTVLADNTNYYASQTLNGVESTDRTAVTAKKISETTQTFLSSNNPTVANLVVTPSTDYSAKWFTTASGGTVLENTTTLSSGTYYVEQNTPLSLVTLGSGFSFPRSVAIQSDGKIVVAHYNAILRMDADGNNIETLGSGSGFNTPTDLAIQSDGKIVVVDYGNSAIKRMDADGKNIEILGSGFSYPSGVAIQSDGKIVVADTHNSVIKRMDADGKNIVTLGSGFSYPTGVAIQSDGKIIVANLLDNGIQRMDADGNNIETLGSGFNRPRGVAIQSDGKIVVADGNNNAIKRMDVDGKNIETLGSGFTYPYGLAIQSDGKILVADTNNNAIKRITDAVTSNRVAVEVVVKVQPTITFADFSKTYGDVAFDLTATSTSTAPITYSVVSGGTGEVTLSVDNITIDKPGTVTLKASVAENATFEAAEKEITLTINKKAISITAVAKTKVYGEDDPTLTYEITTGSLETDDVLSGTLSRTTGETVGEYAISSTLANANYAITFVSADLTITEKEITITADAISKVYGEEDPTLTYEITTGSLETDDVLSGSLNRATGETVGDYAISSTLANANYDITFVSSDFTITQKAITITANAISKVYGKDDPTLTYEITTGSLETDDVLSGSLNRATGEDVGDYAISSTLANANYAITFVSADLSITEKEITITADAISKVYGEDDPTLTYAITTGSLATDDVLSGTLNRATGEDVGDYAISSTLANANYAITFVSADFTITEKAITITADAISKIYGEEDPSLTYAITTGSLATDDVLSGTLSRATGEDVGDYAISSTLANANYAITFVSADLTITKKEITITADAISKVYGEDDPSLTYQITTGSLETDDVLSGSLSRTAGEDVGEYAISSTLANANYAITFVSADFTITKASQTITFNSLVHTDDIFDLTATSSSGLAISYTSSNTGVATISENTVTVLSAGTTTIMASQAGNTNYEAATSVTQELTITALGVKDGELLLSSISLYPNPSANFIKIDLNNLGNATIKIYDLAGKLILDKKQYASKESLDISRLAIGTYIVRIRSNNLETTKKFLKKE